MNKITKFFHELRNPHCDHCAMELKDSKHSDLVETLRMELARIITENERLLNIILAPKPIEESIDTTNLKPVQFGSQHKSWAVRREMLEAEDREKAKLIKEREKNKVIDDKTQALEDEIVNA